MYLLTPDNTTVKKQNYNSGLCLVINCFFIHYVNIYNKKWLHKKFERISIQNSKQIRFLVPEVSPPPPLLLCLMKLPN